MKKSLSLFLAIALIVSMFSSVALAAEDTENTEATEAETTASEDAQASEEAEATDEEAEASEEELDAQGKFDALVEAGILEGRGDSGDAALSDEMTRAEAAVVVTKLFDLDISNPPATATFSDVDSSHWAYQEIEAAAAAGIVNGRGNGEFDPGTMEEVEAGVGHVTVQELAVLLTLGLQEQEGFEIDMNATASGEVAPWAQAYVAAAIDWGLLAEQSSYTDNAIRETLVEATYATEEAIAEANLTVESITVVDASNIEVTFSDGTTKTIKLDEKLTANEENEVTFTYNGKEFTEAVTWEVTAYPDSVRALTESVIEVKLKEGVGSVSASEFSVVTEDGVDTEDGSEIEVEEAKLASSDDSGKTVYLYTEGLEPGALYSVTANEVSKQFAGISDPGDVTFSAFAAEPTQMELESSQPVIVGEDVSFEIEATNYPDETLEIKSVEVEQSKIVLETEQQEGILYEVSYSGEITSVEGEAVDEDSAVEKGRVIDIQYQLTEVEPRSNQVIALDISPDDDIVNDESVLNVENYTLESYDDDSEIAIEKVVNYDSDENDKLALMLSEPTEDNTLYTLSIDNMETKYGDGIDEDYESVTFQGLGEDNEDLGIYDDDAVYLEEPNVVRVYFDDIVEAESATNKENYTITNEDTGDEVPIQKVEISNNDITEYNAETGEGAQVYLHVENNFEDGTLYSVEFENLQDDAGNGLGDEDSVTFAGEDLEGPIDEIEQIVYEVEDGKHQLRVSFPYSPDSDAAEKITNYYIEGLGYPSKVDNSGKDQYLTIPEPESGEVYTLQVSNIPSQDGVEMEDTLEKKFGVSGSSSSANKPVFENVQIVDSHTIALYFNQDVQNDYFDDNFNTNIVSVYPNDDENDADPLSDHNAVVYYSSEDDNVIYVRADEAVYADEDRYTVVIEDSFLNSDSQTAEQFAGADWAPEAPAITGAIFINNKVLEVRYNIPVMEPQPADYPVVDEEFDFVEVAKVSDTRYRLVLADGQTFDDETYTLSVPANELLDASGYVAAGEAGDEVTRQFAGNGDAPEAIDAKSVTTAGIDSHTVQINFPQPMGETVTEDVYNYELINQDGDVVASGDDGIAAVIYDADDQSANLYTSESIEDYSILTLTIAEDVTNALGTSHIEEDFEEQFAPSDDDPEAPTLSLLEAEESNYTITLSLDKAITAQSNDLSGNVSVSRYDNGEEYTVDSASLNADGDRIVISPSDPDADQTPDSGKLYDIVVESTDSNTLTQKYTGVEVDEMSLEEVVSYE